MWHFVLKILFSNRTRMLAMLTSLSGAMLLLVWLTSASFGISFGFTDFMLGGGAPIWVCSNRMDVYMQPENMSETELDKVRSVPGVRLAEPMVYGACNLKIQGKENVGAQLIGISSQTLTGLPLHHLIGDPHSLRADDRIAIDKNLLNSRLKGITLGSELILNEHRVQVGAILDCKPHNMALPVIYCSDTNFRRWTNAGTAPSSSFILVYAEPAHSTASVVEKIRRQCDGLTVMTQDEMIEKQQFWLWNTTPLMAISYASIFICGLFAAAFLSQQFYAFILENTEGLAVMKSLGYSNSDLCRFIFLACGCVWLLSFAVVFVISGAMIRIMVFFPKILYHTPLRILLPIGALMLVICMLSGASVLWKIRSIDPILLFKR